MNPRGNEYGCLVLAIAVFVFGLGWLLSIALEVVR